MLSDEERGLKIFEKIIKIKEKEMNKAVKNLDFETAAILRDEIVSLKSKIVEKNKKWYNARYGERLFRNN